MDYMTLFSSAMREMPRFSALAAAVLQQVTDLQDVVRRIPEAFSLPLAVGAQLDALGVEMGIPRPQGATDEAYRAYISARLTLWGWDGANRSVASLMDDVAPGSNLLDNIDGSVKGYVSGTLPGNAADVLPVPGGISVSTESL